LLAAYTYRDGRTAWDAFPEQWRRIARENARPALLDFRNSIGNYPSPADLANVAVPVVCAYDARSPNSIIRLTRSLAAAIPTARTHQIDGAGHAAPSMQPPISCSRSPTPSAPNSIGRSADRAERH
jgi:pimeloyl-ACP methyl ester carboxylesterase